MSQFVGDRRDDLDSIESAERDSGITPDKPSAINKIVRASLAQPLLMGVISLSLLGAGVWSFLRLPVDAYPDLSPPQVAIVSQWPGHAAEEVERLITVPTETGVNGTPKLKVMRSVSLY